MKNRMFRRSCQRRGKQRMELSENEVNVDNKAIPGNAFWNASMADRPLLFTKINNNRKGRTSKNGK